MKKVKDEKLGSINRNYKDNMSMLSTDCLWLIKALILKDR